MRSLQIYISVSYLNEQTHLVTIIYDLRTFFNKYKKWERIGNEDLLLLHSYKLPTTVPEWLSDSSVPELWKKWHYTTLKRCNCPRICAKEL